MLGLLATTECVVSLIPFRIADVADVVVHGTLTEVARLLEVVLSGRCLRVCYTTVSSGISEC